MKEIYFKIKIFTKSILLSYASIFFSQNICFGSVLFFVSMIYPVPGLCGLFCGVAVNVLAQILSLNKQKIESGMYGFNAVLIGVAIGSLFPFNVILLTILLAVSFFILMLSLWIEGIFQKYMLPFLSFPFLICLWMILLVAQQTDDMTGFGLIMGGNQSLLEIGTLSIRVLTDNALWQPLPSVLLSYFHSLGFVFFQLEPLGGFCIALALFCFSRIAFSVSFLGHLVAYCIFHLIYGEMYQLPFLFYGFNFIFTSIAVGGYFLIPSVYSYLWMLLLIPVQFLVVFSSSRFLSYFYLPTFSLAFSLVTVLFLYLLKRRETLSPKTLLAYYIEKKPEDTLYYYKVNSNRLAGWEYFPISLPFLGEWTVSQAHDGEYTHQGKWKHAWDFVIKDEFGKQYQNSGLALSDYYCYGKPVLAPADGQVEVILDEVEDNNPGEINNIRNWGNYVVIKHTERLYSVVCHLKKGTFKCEPGQKVKKGDILALCGNSGHSPYPHLHFQMQTLALVGSPTLDYPFYGYLLKNGQQLELKLNDKPLSGDTLSAITIDFSLYEAYLWEAGTFVFSEKYGNEKWKLSKDIYNYSYFLCEETGSKAWFVNDGTLFYFLRFEGNKNCNLYYFYLSNYKVMFSLSKLWNIQDLYPLSIRHKKMTDYLQDFIAPFHMYSEMKYSMVYSPKDGLTSDAESCLSSFSDFYCCGKNRSKSSFLTRIHDKKIKEINVKENAEEWIMTFIH